MKKGMNQDEKHVVSYQAGKDQYGGQMFDSANDYMMRKDREQVQSVRKLKSQEYKGRYE